MGTDNPNIVIGADSTGSHNIFRETPLNQGDSSVQNQSGATYHVGIGSGPVQPVEQQTLVELKGFAAGFAQHPDARPDIVANFSASDVTLNFDAGSRSGTLAITNFDNNSFSFNMGASRQTPDKLNGAVSLPSLLAGYAGAANGAFVGPTEAPRGVIGNFGVSKPSDHWQATGVFGGTSP